jgi:hypothetical protein
MNVRNNTSPALLPAMALALALSSVACGKVADAAETYQHDAIGRLTDVSYANGGSLHYSSRGMAIGLTHKELLRGEAISLTQIRRIISRSRYSQTLLTRKPVFSSKQHGSAPCVLTSSTSLAG